MNLPDPVPLRLQNLPQPLELYVHGAQDRYVSHRLRTEGVWEPYETALLRAFLRPGDVFVDVGANIGYFSLIAAAAVGPSGAVVAIEPDPDNCRLLRASARRNGLDGRIDVVEGGLAGADGDGRLYRSADNLGDHQIFDAAEGRASLPIRLFRGADLLAQRIDRLDLLKIDTQGSEYQVLAGLMPLLATLARPPRVILELTPYALRQAGASGRELVALLARLRQPLWIIDHLEHRLAPCTAEDLATWCDNVDGWQGDRGFMNILSGAAP